MAYCGRLAPSPTGLLHLGHARTFLIAAERAAAAGGTLLLRLDDLDAQRSRPEFVVAVKEDLDWLGIRWAGDMVEQSRRLELYGAAFEHLRASGAIYPCVCSRRDLQTAAHAPHAEDEDEPIYPGTCRNRSPIAEQETAWRFRVPDGEVIRFTDALLGPQDFIAGQDFGDFIVLRRDGVPSYQLATVVDDAAMRITEVVRGRDLLRSTARQLLLQRALGYPEPAYAHCDLVLNERGERLAKRDAARSIRALREAGLSAVAVCAMALDG